MRLHSPLAALLSVGLLALSAQAARADALNFFNNWFVTGDYTVAGVGLKNTGGVGSIKMSGVPCTTGVGPSAAIAPCTTKGAVQAYPVAAFLYWEAVESTSTAAAANGMFDTNAITGTVLGSDAFSKCWVTGPSQTLRVYRADVLRFLPIDPTSGIRLANYTHTVKLGSGVSGNTGVLTTEGASLVVIYRIAVPGKPLLMPFRSVVIHDGEFTLSPRQPLMSLNILGFYQSSFTSPAATMTHVVGNGQASYRETLTAAGSAPAGVSSTEPFVGAQGAGWDNLTFGFNIGENAFSTETAVTLNGGAPDCLSWSAVVTSTNVQDSDNDGLLDLWEQQGIHRNTQVSPATFGTCVNYPLEPCVNLPAMGAVNGVKDIFLQVDWMHGYGNGTGGLTGNGYHDHMPQLAALTQVATAFSKNHIALHFDVGNNYQGLGLPYIIPYKTGGYEPTQLAQGGNDIDESTLVCVNTATHTCDYQEPYPVLSFKLGLDSIRDGNHLLNIPAHFAQNRKDIFHYALFAHALAGPFNLMGEPSTPAPLSYSGVGDRPGGDLMVTFGLWSSAIPANDQVGSVLLQAATLMHELGHNLNLSHAGWSTGPNCMPNYPSVMSYLYQTRGLTDVNGVEQIDYSYGKLAGLNENSLSASESLGSLQYRLRFYGPLNPLLNSPGQASQVHCDGTPITNGAQELRLEGPGLSTPDWSNGTVTPLTKMFAQDVSFDGPPLETFADQPDWSSLNLAQIGSRSNFGSLSVGSLSTDAGSLSTDAGSLATDAGSLSTDVGSLATDAGSLSTDAGDEDYISHILTSTDGIPTPQQCTGCGLTATTGSSGSNAIALAKPAPSGSNAIALAQLAPSGSNAIVLAWTPPGTGGTLTYNIYRCAGAGCVPAPPALAKGWVPASASAPTYTDTVDDFVHAGATCPSTSTCYNTTYIYTVTAVSTAVSSVGSESGYSNTTAPGNEVAHLYVIANNQAVVYGSANPSPTFQIYGDVSGSLSASLVSCAYTGTPRNAGNNYTITCTGPATTSTTDGVTYLPSNGVYLSYTGGTLTISQRPITVKAAASSKTYDGTTTSTSTPTITSAVGLAYSDTVTWTESYDNRNAGTTHVMTPAGTVSDGNGGNNYAVTFATIATGVISKAALTIAAVTNTKTYDGNISAAAVPTVSGLQTGVSGVQTADSVTGLAETYNTANAGTGKTLSVSAYTVNDGNGGGNYTVSLNTNTTGIINKANPTITVTPYSVTYDGNSHTATGTATGVLLESLSGLVLSGTTHTNAGTYNGDPWTFTDVTGNYYNANGAVNDSIAQATPTVTATGNTSCTFNGSVCAGSGTATGVLTPTDTLTPVTLSYSGTGYGPTPTAPTNAGTYTVTASFAGNTNYKAGNSSPANITIAQATPTVTATGNACTFNGSVCAGSGTATGVLTPTDTLTPVTLSYSGTGSPSTAPTNAGSYTVTAIFAGNTNYKAGTSSPANITVAQATPAVTDSGPTPAAPDYGQPVTLTVTVAPPQSGEVPTGTVTFSFTLNSITNYICSNGTISASTPACTVSLTSSNGNYAASVITSNLPTGVDSVMAAYSGDTNFQGETATPVSVTVSQANSAVTLTSSADPSTYGQSVTLTVKVADITGSIGVPTGTVTLSFQLDRPNSPLYYICADGTIGTTVCSNPVTLAPDQNDSTAATATVTTTSLPAGLSVYSFAYAINASYSGDTNFLPSGLSGGLSQTVNQAMPMVTATGNNCPYSPSSACAGSGTATGVLSPADSLPVTLSYSGAGGTSYGPSATAPTNAGNYTVTANFAGNANYTTGTSAPANITIGPATATVMFNVNSLSTTYNGSPQLPTVTTAPPGLAVTLSGAPQTNAGSYLVTASLNNPNYTASPAMGTFVIGQLGITASITANNKNFDGTNAATIATCTPNVLPSDAGNVTCTASNATFSSFDPGSWPVTATTITLGGVAGSNYAPPSTATTTVNATISDAINLSALSFNGISYTPNTTSGPLQLTNNGTGGTAASSWLPTAIPVSSAFSTTFHFQITPTSTGAQSIADGFAFVIQGVSNTTYGGGGGDIGYAEIPNSIAFEFDTYYNSENSDPTPSESLPYAAHIGIQSLGASANSADHSAAGLATPKLADFDDGNPHTATITYDGNSTLAVSLDNGLVVVSATLSNSSTLGSFLGLTGGSAYIGFTAGTGSNSETTKITSWTWDY